MKKLFMIMMAVALIMGFGTSAYAGYQTQVTLTSPAIVKSGCEKVGAVTYSLAAGSILTEGDWWYIDLPAGTNICNPVDYFIVGWAGAGVAGDNVTYPAAGSLLGVPTADATDVDLVGVAPIGALVATGAPNGPLSMTDLGAGIPIPLTPGVDPVVLRVVAAANSQRVWVYVYGVDTGGGVGSVGSVTVTPQTSLEIVLINGQDYPNNILMNNTTTGTPADTIWGNDPSDTINITPLGTPAGRNIPHVENTLCVNAEQMSGSLMFTSFASLNDFLTFTGDSQIAHVVSVSPLSLAFCKGDTTGNILIAGQNACAFNYQTAAGYCPGPPAGLATFLGNRIFLQGTTTFGDPGDRYDMTITSNTAGVYFSAAPVLTGFTPAATNECTVAGAAVAGAFVSMNEAGLTPAPYDATGSCSVAAVNRIRNVSTGTGGAITGIDTYDALWITLPAMVYDTSIIGNGVESDIIVSVNKYPCGQIFSEELTIGTFVTTCPVGAGGTSLLYPFMPPLDGSIPGWWGGFIIVNGGTAAGTAVLTLVEDDGDSATFTTPSIAAGGMWNAGSMADFLASVTPNAGNAGTFGDANVSITAVCAFNLGGGFAFTGNGDEGTGYTAYVLGATGWN